MSKVKENNCTCQSCGKEFYAPRCWIARGGGKYCCYECANIGRTKERVCRICKFCGKKFFIVQSELNRDGNSGIFCGKSCAGKSRTGSNGSNWLGGRTMENKLARNKVEYIEWRNKIFERDDYTCQHCKKRGGKLNAHHIIPFSVDETLRYELSNGTTLCEKCHNKEHTRLSSTKNNQIDIFEINRRKHENYKQE